MKKKLTPTYFDIYRNGTVQAKEESKLYSLDNLNLIFTVYSVDLVDEVRSFMNSKTPLVQCFYCFSQWYEYTLHNHLSYYEHLQFKDACAKYVNPTILQDTILVKACIDVLREKCLELESVYKSESIESEHIITGDKDYDLKVLTILNQSLYHIQNKFNEWEKLVRTVYDQQGVESDLCLDRPITEYSVELIYEATLLRGMEYDIKFILRMLKRRKK